MIEPAVGVDRILLAVLCAGYAEEDVKDEKGNVEKRTVLRFSPRIAPVKVAVPLLKNKALTQRPGAHQLRRAMPCSTTTAAPSATLPPQDEAGTPWCVTIDFETVEKDGTFTLRPRLHTAKRQKPGACRAARERSILTRGRRPRPGGRPLQRLRRQGRRGCAGS